MTNNSLIYKVDIQLKMCSYIKCDINSVFLYKFLSKALSLIYEPVNTFHRVD